MQSTTSTESPSWALRESTMFMFIPLLMLTSVSLLNSQKRADLAGMSTKAIEIMGMETGYKCTQADRDPPLSLPFSQSTTVAQATRHPPHRFRRFSRHQLAGMQLFPPPGYSRCFSGPLFFTAAPENLHCIFALFVLTLRATCAFLYIRGSFRPAPPAFWTKDLFPPRVLP